MARGSASAAAPITLEPLDVETLAIEIKGTSPLIMNAWSQKAFQLMLDNERGIKHPREPKDPEADYLASQYRLSDGVGYGMPATAFKLATVSGARFFKGSITMASLKPLLYVYADDPESGLVQIHGEPRPREDWVRVGQGTSIRYRSEFVDWSAILRVEFMPHMIDPNSVVSLVHAGGRVGVGDWRPEKGGINGMYEVVQS